MDIEDGKTTWILLFFMIVQIVLSVLFFLNGLEFMRKDRLGFMVLFILVAFIMLVSGVLLQMEWGIAYYSTWILGVIILLGNLIPAVLGYTFDLLIIILSLVLVSILFFKKTKEFLLAD
ncbi:MAG: hypothetical protein KC589_09090 [Nanoarchaeota archaeon]|nr:hypothetical protein [Nanoarchaeota archaeon]